MLKFPLQAAANTRVVGAAIAFMIRKMKDRGADLDNFWLIGHSLGAHIMGFVGRRVKGIGRITGLDPAEPRFEGEFCRKERQRDQQNHRT